MFERINFLAYYRPTGKKEIFMGAEVESIEPAVMLSVDPKKYRSVKIQKSHGDMARELLSQGVKSDHFIAAGLYDITNAQICEWWSDTVKTGDRHFLPKEAVTELLNASFNMVHESKDMNK
jgi:hypothetical protein